MQAGRLRHTITLQSPSVTGQNTFGEDTVSWATVGSYPCRVEYLEGQELEDALQRWARARYRITMRHQPSITVLPTWRAVWGTITMDLLSIQDPADNMRPEVLIFAQDYEGETTGA